MLKIIALLLGVLSPLSFMSDAQPDSSNAGNGTKEPAVRQAVYHMADEINAGHSEKFGIFKTMNGISLNDSKNDVIMKKGKPIKLTQDRLTGCSEYHYNDAVVVVCDGIVDYVHVALSAEKMQINGSWVPLKKDNISSALGKPQFVADDGQVYIRGHQVIKVYDDPDTGALLGADFFDESSE